MEPSAAEVETWRAESQLIKRGGVKSLFANGDVNEHGVDFVERRAAVKSDRQEGNCTALSTSEGWLSRPAARTVRAANSIHAQAILTNARMRNWRNRARFVESSLMGCASELLTAAAWTPRGAT